MPSAPITFIVPGQDRRAAETSRGSAAAAAPLPPEVSLGELKQSVAVGVGRAAGGDVRVEAVPDEDVVVLQLANGPTLMLHPETVRDLMLAQGAGSSRGAQESPPGQVPVPAQLRWEGLQDVIISRGAGDRLGRVLLSAVHVITGVGGSTAATKVAEEVAKRVDAQVEPGVYRLQRDRLAPLKDSGIVPGVDVPPSSSAPLLVLIHGTFSNTSGTFGKLWTEHRELVATLFREYGERVYALDHPTLGQSPFDNALTLAEQLPKQAQLHLVTHSRGGLVAETLACAAADGQLSPEQRAFFAQGDWVKQLEKLERLRDLLKQKEIQVKRVVRVACPARGTLLASNRLDAYLSVLKWALELARVPVAPVIVEFLAQVAKERTDPAVLPGLAAQVPNSPLIEWIHSIGAPLLGQLRVVAGDGEGDSITSWLKTLMSDAFYWTDNDLVVQTRSMYGGAPRTEVASFVLDRGSKVSHFT